MTRGQKDNARPADTRPPAAPKQPPPPPPRPSPTKAVHLDRVPTIREYAAVIAAAMPPLSGTQLTRVSTLLGYTHARAALAESSAA